MEGRKEREEGYKDEEITERGRKRERERVAGKKK